MFNNAFKGKKVLITGHTGFKGSWLVLWLKLMGADVYGIAGISGSPSPIPTHPSLFQVAGLQDMVTTYKQDIRNLEAIKTIFNEVKPDFVFHMAAQAIVKKAYESPVDCMSINIMGTVNILEALRQFEHACVGIIVTSDKCYENVERKNGYVETDPLGGKDPYSASKAAAELMAKTYHHSFFSKNSPVKISSVRSGNVIGGGDWAPNRIVPDCFRAWANGEKVIIRSPKAVRPWQHVLEPLSGYLRTAQLLASADADKINGEPFNFGPPTDKDYTVLELIEELATGWQLQNQQLQVEPSNFYEPGLLNLNIDKALEYLEWKPTLSFQETAAFTSSWYNQYYQNQRKEMLEFTSGQINDYIALAQKQDFAWTRSTQTVA